jgi:hypothetical protein
MLVLPQGLLVAPDLLCIKMGGGAGANFWLEAKAKSIPSWRRIEGRWEHGIDYANMAEYADVQAKSRMRVILSVYEEKSPSNPYRDSFLTPAGLWLFISMDKAEDAGTHRPDWPGGKMNPRDRGKSGKGGWLWPRHEMSEDPTVESAGAEATL